MTYKRDEGKVVYGNPGREKRVFEAMDFLALLASHIPDKFENRILYYGFCLPSPGGSGTGRSFHEGGEEIPGTSETELYGN
jgi:hypothetical protein